MTRPKIDTTTLVQFLIKIGKFRVFDRKGSHIIMIQENTQRQLQLPERKEIGEATLSDVLTRAGLSIIQLVEFIYGKKKARSIKLDW